MTQLVTYISILVFMCLSSSSYGQNNRRNLKNYFNLLLDSVDCPVIETDTLIFMSELGCNCPNITPKESIILEILDKTNSVTFVLSNCTSIKMINSRIVNVVGENKNNILIDYNNYFYYPFPYEVLLLYKNRNSWKTIVFKKVNARAIKKKLNLN